MGRIEKKLEELGLSLSLPRPPIGNYVGGKRAGNLYFASGRVSDCTGEVGTEVTLVQAREAARDTVLVILAIIKQEIKELDSITGVLKLTGFVRSASSFTEQPKVIDGASDILVSLFGENGRHARTATGVAQLPTGASVQLDIIFLVNQKA